MLSKELVRVFGEIPHPPPILELVSDPSAPFYNSPLSWLLYHSLLALLLLLLLFILTDLYSLFLYPIFKVITLKNYILVLLFSLYPPPLFDDLSPHKLQP